MLEFVQRCPLSSIVVSWKFNESRLPWLLGAFGKVHFGIVRRHDKSAREIATFPQQVVEEFKLDSDRALCER